jgi:indolepyruvate ferredoxin oxidoreductase
VNQKKTFAVLNGNEIIVEAGLEAGFSLYTGYPGSPLADFFNILHEKKAELAKLGIKVVIANSEANAAAMCSGAKQAGRDTLLGMKSMGLHVASDALSVGNFANPYKPKKNAMGEDIYPGVVVVVGDDPWSISTSTPADSRFLYKHLHIPFLEPSTPEELKEFIIKALELSKKSSIYVGVLLTTYMAEGGGLIEVGSVKNISQEKDHLIPSDFDLSQNVMVPPNSLMADRRMIDVRFPKFLEVYRKANLDKIFGDQNSKIGFIAAGSAFETLKQVLEESDNLNSFSLYKVAGSYPLVEDKLGAYLEKLEHLVIVEEKRGFLEQELHHLIQKKNLKLKTYGKEAGFPAYGGLSYEIIRDTIEGLFKRLGVESFPQKEVLAIPQLEAPRRLPTFCPGCPHRETLSLLKDLRGELKKKGIDLISHGDVGCYSLSFLEPFKEMHNLSAMGQGGALGAGVDMFTTNPSVVLMGDSTFFHSGLTDISNSVQMGHTITYILLDNDNTAMTGHQMTPSSGFSVDGVDRPKQKMSLVSKSLGVAEVHEVNPSDRYFYKNLLSEIVYKNGVKVIVSNKECGLTFQSKVKVEERKIFAAGGVLPRKTFYQINPDACEDCRICVEMTGCPGLTQVEDAYGKKMSIDPSICVADSYCTKFKVCPSFEKVEVLNYHPTKYKVEKVGSMGQTILNSPLSLKSFEQIQAGNDLRIVVSGVGGSGVTTISKLLSRASLELDPDLNLGFKFVDQKGLAQRNGRVTGHLSLYDKKKASSPINPLHSCDLVLSPDLFDGLSVLNYLAPQGLALIDTESQIPLGRILDAEETKVQESEENFVARAREVYKERIRFISFKKLSVNHFGKNLYASSIVLGAAYQSGKLPFLEESFLSAIKASFRGIEIENNISAFKLGREVFANGEEKYLKAKVDFGTLDLLTTSLKESAHLFENKKKLEEKFLTNLSRLEALGLPIEKSYLARYLHDLLIYDRGEKLESYFKDCQKIMSQYKGDNLKLALKTLSKTYFIKDEVFVSHMMISPMISHHDENLYKNLGSHFKKTRLNRPAFELLGKTIEFDLSPKDWMLKVMRHLRILRVLLPSWHSKEKKIASEIRTKVLSGLDYTALKQLESIKGYRQVRYDKAQAKGLSAL